MSATFSLLVSRVVFRRFLALLLACGHSKLAGRFLGELQELHDAVHRLGLQSRQVLGLAHLMAVEHMGGEDICDLCGGNQREEDQREEEEEEEERERDEEKKTERKRDLNKL